MTEKEVDAGQSNIRLGLVIAAPVLGRVELMPAALRLASPARSQPRSQKTMTDQLAALECPQRRGRQLRRLKESPGRKVRGTAAGAGWVCVKRPKIIARRFLCQRLGSENDPPWHFCTSSPATAKLPRRP